jgi:hypothetical protein
VAAWPALLKELEQVSVDQRAAWLSSQMLAALSVISGQRGGRNVLFYSSAFLQKPQAGAATSLTFEELNGFMSCLFGMNCKAGLTLVLHTPGGATNAAETIVQYLYSKFDDIEVIVPTYAMSAGTMISLAANRIIMGRQSQLGPIDPQMPLRSGFVSARSVVDQFEKAKAEVISNLELAHAWAPILQSLGPALLVEAQNALDYGERMVAQWLRARMFATAPDAQQKAERVARHFNDAGTHKSHGRRIDRDEARREGVNVEFLEENQAFQDCVLTAYHLSTIVFEQSPTLKFIWSHHGPSWVKNSTAGHAPAA